MSNSISTNACPACGHYIAVPFFDGMQQPLATLGWPASEKEARGMARLPLDFVRCIECGHVFNIEFDYAHVPYSKNPNLMFNRGSSWSRFLSQVRDAMLSQLPDEPTVVEIGHGDASFLRALAELRPAGRYIGFDPHGAKGSADGVELRCELFEADTHFQELTPDLILSRHVLEHLMNPLGFLQQLSYCASILGKKTLAYFEVPCIDRAIKSCRTVDFYYEHSSQFTTSSFYRMISRSGGDPLDIGHGYEGEVVFGFVQFGSAAHCRQATQDAEYFFQQTSKSRNTIQEQLNELVRQGKTIAIWGGTGKSSAFMCRYQLDAESFPLVVDSDIDKVGTFVPGTAQQIQFRDALLDQKIEVLIIPPQWRAADILAEMSAANISVGQILIEHEGKMIDYHQDAHPYA